ncbi:MAG: hypothetical protein PHI29_12520 [Gallionella sp.]|nr:hypothetical protein [Gallionella sp.]
MFQKGSYDFENQLADFIAIESAAADKNKAVNGSKAGSEMLDAQREQQRSAITRNLNNRH